MTRSETPTDDQRHATGRRVLSAADRVSLGSPRHGHLVLTGSVQVFSVERMDDGSHGRMTPLVTCGQGSLVVGTDAIADPTHELVVVGSPDATVADVDLGEMREGALAGNTAAVAILIERWITRLMAATYPHPPQSTPTDTSVGASVDIAADQPFAAGQRGLWLSFEHDVQLWGEDCGGVIPCAPHVPVVTSTTVTARVVSGQEALGSASGWQGFEQMLAMCYRWIGERSRLATESELSRRAALREYEAGFVAAVEGDAHDVLLGRTGSRSNSYVSSPFLVAVEHVAKVSGVAFDPAPLSMIEGADDPLGVCARYSGFGVRRVSLGSHWYDGDAGPLLGVGKEPEGEWLPLIRRRRGYQIRDLRTGRSRPVDQDSDRQLARAYQLYAAAPVTSRLRTLVRFALFRSAREVVVALLLFCLIGLFTLIPAFALDFLQGEGATPLDVTTTAILSAALGAYAIGIAALGIFAARVMVRVEVRSTMRLQGGLLQQVLTQPMSYLRKVPAAEVLAVMTDLSSAQGQWLRIWFTGTLGGAMTGIALVTLAVLTGDSIGWILAVVVLFALLFTVSLRTMHRARHTDRHARAALEALTASLLTGIAKIRLAHAERRAALRWLSQFSTAQVAHRERLRQRLRQEAMVGGLVCALVLASMPWLSTSSAPLRSVTAVPSFGATLAVLAIGIRLLAECSTALVDALTTRSGLLDIAGSSELVAGRSTISGGPSGRIELAQVSYRIGELDIVRDVSFEVEAGEMVAIIGPSGSGKSTLLSLLLGLEEASSGAILYDNHDLRSLDGLSVRQECGVVLQSTRLISGSIRENVAGSRSLGDDQVNAALRAVGLHELVDDLPMGLDTLVNEYSGVLSGGQQQLLILARAIAGSPRIVFLDEATSALDNQTQARVMHAIERMDATRVVVAHRLSTIRQADRIIVLDQGRVVQQGSYAKLAEEDGLFQRLIRRQQVAPTTGVRGD
ncbi:ATP-binding cassette domain-containing protein [Rudaeicoccus suwonensis]|uniref:ABC-type bacteriocin/lantibiotic exporter with double-glycine peptidase domain n=1 Tax=Rudaeicoccus suwonensis TaxID=657409 RepID=A0A561ECQ3_9MICO|nr:ATP-binding cassette domain-containing protein [Rudaeicoccus suwonensis]TWE13393.1 ABC-type bacteriocin/lantibiotic exporter with double-glycine peptidase domain [Rudaeicoccus suwonensis]